MEPYPIKFNGEPKLIVRNNEARLAYLVEHPEVSEEDVVFSAIALFRHRSYCDYIAIAEVNDKDGSETWTPVYEKYEMVDWMAGFALEEGGRRWHELHTIHRSVGEFALKYGWNPDVVIEDEPNETEFDGYITYVTSRQIPEGV